MLSGALSPLKRPPSLLSCHACYQGNATVTEASVLAPHSGSESSLHRGTVDILHVQKPPSDELNLAITNKNGCNSRLYAACKYLI